MLFIRFYRYYGALLLLHLTGGLLNAHVPFDPELNSVTGLPVLYEQDTYYQKGKLLAYNKNAIRNIQDGSLYTFTKKDSWDKADLEDEESDEIITLRKWQEEDQKAGRIFRPWLFYDVMGISEPTFKNLFEQQKNYFPILNFMAKNKNHAYPTTTDLENSMGLTAPFEHINANFPHRISSLYGIQFNAKQDPKAATELSVSKISELENRWDKHYNSQVIPQEITGKIQILDGYYIWDLGKKEKLTKEDEKFLYQWNIPKQAGMMEALKFTDIRYLQSTYPHAYFQLASTVTMIEGGALFGKNNLMSMTGVTSQGETATLATLGGTILRYYVYQTQNTYNLLQKNQEPMIGFHKNVLATSGYYPPFIRTTDDTLKEYSNTTEQPIYINLNNEKYFTDIQAITKNNALFNRDQIKYLFKKDFANNNTTTYVYNGTINREKPVIIHQIFAVASIVDRSDMIKKLKDSKESLSRAQNILPDPTKKLKDTSKARAEETITKVNAVIDDAKKVLHAMYKGTFLLAALDDNPHVKVKKLFLTLLGGAAYENEIAWIMDALDQQIIKEIIAKTGMEVILILFPDIRPHATYKSLSKGLDSSIYDTYSEKDADKKPGSALTKIREKIQKINTDIEKLSSELTSEK